MAQARQYLEAEKVQKPTQDITELFDVDADIRAMRANFAFEFFEIFRMGYQNYAEGEWKVAERFLSRAYAIGERRGSPDGPSAAPSGSGGGLRRRRRVVQCNLPSHEPTPQRVAAAGGL